MILISGEALIDLIPDPVKANGYDAVLGGSPYNVAIGLARLGSQTAFVSRISEDGNGEALLAAGLADNGVNLSFVLRDDRPSTLAFVMRGTAKPVRAIRSISMRPRSMALGRFRRSGRKAGSSACGLDFGGRPAAWPDRIEALKAAASTRP